MMDEILLLIRIALFAIFALAGIGKLMDIEGSEKAVKGFGVPDALAKPVGIGLPIFEIFLAFGFLFIATSWFAAVLAVLLIAVFLGGMIYQIAQGNAPDCHCFGQIHSEPVGKSSLIRNGIFGVLALSLAVQGSDGQGASLVSNNSGMASTLIMILVLGLLAVAVYFLKRIFDQQGEIMRRIELLEVISRDGGQVERVEGVPPTEGLAIGSPVPNFALMSIEGETVSRDDVFGNGRPSLVFFVSPECGPCKALFPEIKKWQAELGEKLDLIFFSSGTIEDNKAKYGDAENIRILIQEKREVAESVKAQWTPAALFVDRNGNIASYVSTGDKAIKDLIEELRSRDLADDYVYVANMNGLSQPLKIGERVPEFSFEAVNGETLNADSITGRKTLAVLWGMTCPHCVDMHEALLEWDRSRNGNDPNLLVLVSGDEEEAARGLGFLSPTVAGKGSELAKSIGLQGTPSAILIDEHGKITSSNATGAEKIWALIGKRL